MDATIVPISISDASNNRLQLSDHEIEETSFRQLSVNEADLEEFVRKHIDIIFPDETLLIVGQQVINESRGRSDLVAIDDSASIVLIELKRDAQDMRRRAESLEVQAVRYAANYAMIGLLLKRGLWK